MTEDAESANEIADYLDSKQVPLLKGRVLNIHTRLKGRIKTVKRGGREIKEFVESETGMKPDDLRALREMSRALDSKDSPYRCVVSVMMLREGWDVRNVTTIVPLRPYSAKAGILPEQTLGRGLRRMIPLGDVPETVTVVHHPAFRKLYEEELAQEGLDIAVLPIHKALKETVTIFVDREHKDIDELELEIPLVSDAIETTTTLDGLTFDEIRQYFHAHFTPLPIGNKKDGPIEYKERHLFTDEVVARMQLDSGLLTAAWSAPSYFAKMLGAACHLTNAHQTLTALVEQFIAKVLFEREVDLYAGQVDHRMRDLDVMEYIRATFMPLILAKVVTKKARTRVSQGQKLSEWKPYQATSTARRPAVPAERTPFNLVPCENDFEQAFAKNAGPQKLMIDYLRPDGHRALYAPDFIVRLTSGRYVLAELKGREDSLVTGGQWQYLFVPYLLFQQSAAATVEELLRACAPSLQELVKEFKTGQLALPLEETTARQRADELFARVLRQADITQPPAAVADIMRQAVDALDHDIRAGYSRLGGAFQPLREPLDSYALRILSQRLAPKIPRDNRRQNDHFNPSLHRLSPRERSVLEKNQRYLRDNLVYGRSIQKLGTLLFCLEYAQKLRWGADGVWRDVETVFAGKAMAQLYNDLNPVNDFRNRYIAHIVARLNQPDEAWIALTQWLRCINRMAALAKSV